MTPRIDQDQNLWQCSHGVPDIFEILKSLGTDLAHFNEQKPKAKCGESVFQFVLIFFAIKTGFLFKCKIRPNDKAAELAKVGDHEAKTQVKLHLM